MGKITAAITGVGLYLHDYILTNEELSTMVDTSDEWIMSHIADAFALEDMARLDADMRHDPVVGRVEHGA